MSWTSYTESTPLAFKHAGNGRKPIALPGTSQPGHNKIKSLSGSIKLFNFKNDDPSLFPKRSIRLDTTKYELGPPTPEAHLLAFKHGNGGSHRIAWHFSTGFW
ncbi:hypothetical protein AVEN_3462-1 [Araneus ventricosus]|uniref:Uncharacterized protein n=1 Tax=Araneus ventricosus TaxID=182803 RepID=A0A4Y2UZT1_ARAVE|nr:hypothetical protein AVEN_3462-1 [Araneus ventricosus]